MKRKRILNQKKDYGKMKKGNGNLILDFPSLL